MSFDYYKPACHEAAHAVGSYLLGVPIRAVYVTPGASSCDSGVTFGEAERRGLALKCAVVAQLGPAVEDEMFGARDAVCCEADLDVIERGWLPRIRKQGGEAVGAKVVEMAAEIVHRPGFLDAVRALADELLRRPGIRKEVTGDQAVTVIREALAR